MAYGMLQVSPDPSRDLAKWPFLLASVLDECNQSPAFLPFFPVWLVLPYAILPVTPGIDPYLLPASPLS